MNDNIGLIYIVVYITIYSCQKLHWYSTEWLMNCYLYTEWFTFLVPAYPGCPGNRPLNGCSIVVVYCGQMVARLSNCWALVTFICHIPALPFCQLFIKRRWWWWWWCMTYMTCNGLPKSVRSTCMAETDFKNNRIFIWQATGKSLCGLSRAP